MARIVSDCGARLAIVSSAFMARLDGWLALSPELADRLWQAARADGGLNQINFKYGEGVWRHAYRESLKSRRAGLRAESDWRRATDDFRRRVADLNRRTAAYNLKAPSSVFRKSPVDADREIGRVMRDE